MDFPDRRFPATGRRQALRLLGLSALAAIFEGKQIRGAGAADETLRFTALDHVEISVPDSARSAAFYARLFGDPVWKNNQTERRYVRLGSRYIAIEKGREPLGVDHFSAGIEGFEIAAMHAWLEQRGIAYRDYPSGKDLNVSDPDGIRLQLSAENTWSQLEGRTASPEPGSITREPIFRPTGLDHILLNVSNPERSAEFYRKIFGPVTQRNNNRIWFQAGKSRIGLLRAPSGQKPGVNHFCVAAAPFDYAAVTRRLAETGAKVEAPEVAGAAEFRDLDGLLVQVIPPSA